MRVAAYIPLHYGADYLPYAIESVINHIDKLFVLYTQRPSYGHRGKLPCPEGRSMLRDICHSAAGGKLEFIDIKLTFREGDHRNQIYRYVDSFDVLANIDADEVWRPEAFETALKYVYDNKDAYSFGAHHSGWKHLWRSFNEYCTDGFCPIRFWNLKNDRRIQDINCPSEIYHFGYAQKRQIMDYKWSIHGHQDEIRPRWVEDIYMGYEKGKTEWLHPVSLQIWQKTEDLDKMTMPPLLHKHPFFNEEKIS